jgi:phospholipid/cholesterol/gamma-HCH transport system substrate-binding protein
MKKEIQVGLIMIFALGVLIWGINFLKGKNFFSRTVDYIVIYDDVSGLMESNGVYIKGYKVGNVQTISFSDSTLTQLKVVLSIKRDVQIPKGTVARIYNLDLIGNKAVELILSKEKKLCKPNDTIKGEVEITFAKQLEPYKVQAYNLLQSLDSLTHAVMSIFDPATNERIRQAIRNIQITTQNIAENIEKTNQSMENIKLFTQNLKDNNNKINSIVSNVNNFSKSLNQLELKQRVDQLDSILLQTQSILRNIEKGNGTISRLIQNDTLYNSLQTSIADLDSLLKDVKERPSRYIHFSVFGNKNNK